MGVRCDLQHVRHLSDKGYAVSRVQTVRHAFDVRGLRYLVWSSSGCMDFDDGREGGTADQLTGRFGYETEGCFRPAGPTARGSCLEFAGWGVWRVGKIGPGLIVVRRSR